MTDPARSAAAAAIMTGLLAAALVVISLWLKRRVCHRDSHMQRQKRVIDELYGVSSAAVILVGVTTVQLVLLGGLVTLTPTTAAVDLMKFRLLVRLGLLAAFSVCLLVIGAAIRVYVSKLDILMDRDKRGFSVPDELRKPFPWLRKHSALGFYGSLQFVFFYFITNLFTAYREVLHF